MFDELFLDKTTILSRASCIKRDFHRGAARFRSSACDFQQPAYHWRIMRRRLKPAGLH